MNKKEKIIEALDGNDWVHIGNVGVDSGTLMIGDPCYLNDKEDWNSELYDKWIVGKLGEENKVSVQISEMCPEQAVAFESGFGDGCYEVYALVKDYGKNLGKRIKEVRVVLIED